MEFYRHTLANGLRIIHKPIEGPIAHCGLVINVGSRDEQPGQDAQHGGQFAPARCEHHRLAQITLFCLITIAVNDTKPNRHSLFIKL